MIEVVGINLGKNKGIEYFLPGKIMMEKGLDVVVETDRGLQIGKIITEKRMISEKSLKFPLGKVIREVTKKDYLQNQQNEEDSNLAFIECKRLIKRHKLPMSLIDASYTLNKNQLLFRFYADERVDFRKLVKELAALYKTRIELRQVGIRDKAKEIGGIGPCGRVLCCSKFLYDFDIISINMAKNQNIALNPNKINGACGRLLCCFSYENEEYKKIRKGLPSIGDIIETEKGRGTVLNVDVLKEKYDVEIKGQEIITVKKE